MQVRLGHRRRNPGNKWSLFCKWTKKQAHKRKGACARVWHRSAPNKVSKINWKRRQPNLERIMGSEVQSQWHLITKAAQSRRRRPGRQRRWLKLATESERDKSKPKNLGQKKGLSMSLTEQRSEDWAGRYGSDTQERQVQIMMMIVGNKLGRGTDTKGGKGKGKGKPGSVLQRLGALRPQRRWHWYTN